LGYGANEGAKMKTILQRIAALYLFCASTSAFAANLQNSSFWVGYNEAWFADKYINWLASNPSFLSMGQPYPSGFDYGFVDTVFYGMQKGNAKIVRIWVFPGLQGIKIDTGGLTIGLTDEFKSNPSNLQQVLSLAKIHGLKVYITALNANDAPYHQPYFNNLFNDSGREVYKNNALLPLLKILNANQDVVYALDVNNEIEGAINAGFVTWTGAQNWIRNIADFVHTNSQWLPVTSSAGGGWAVQEITFGFFSGLKLDFYDLHVYSDKGQYSGMTSLCNKVSADKSKVILGEFGRKSHADDQLLQASATYQFLYGANSHCFSAALAWMYETSQVWWAHWLPSNGTFRKAYCTIQKFPASWVCP
jgi:hypothetical protein